MEYSFFKMSPLEKWHCSISIFGILQSIDTCWFCKFFFNFQNKYVPYEPQDTNLIRSDMTNKHKRPHTFVYCIITACSSVLNIILRTCKYISFSANWIQRGSNALIHSKRYFFSKKSLFRLITLYFPASANWFYGTCSKLPQSLG